MSDEPHIPAYHAIHRGPFREFNVRTGDRSGLLTCIYHKTNKAIRDGAEAALRARLLVWHCECGEYVECTEAGWMACEPKPMDCGCGRFVGVPRVKKPKLKKAPRYKNPPKPQKPKLGRKPLEPGVTRRSTVYSLNEGTIERITELAQLRNISRSRMAEECIVNGLAIAEEDRESYL